MKLNRLKQIIKEEILREIKVERRILNIDPKLQTKWESNSNMELHYSFKAAMKTFKELEKNGLETAIAEIVPIKNIDWLWDKHVDVIDYLNPEEATLLFKNNNEQIVIIENHNSYVLETNVPRIAELPEVKDHISANKAAQIINDWYNSII